MGDFAEDPVARANEVTPRLHIAGLEARETGGALQVSGKTGLRGSGFVWRWLCREPGGQNCHG